MREHITEANLDESDEAIPGIVAFWPKLVDKPRFVGLVQLFLRAVPA